jgi:rubredoxin
VTNTKYPAGRCQRCGADEKKKVQVSSFGPKRYACNDCGWRYDSEPAKEGNAK